MHWVTLLAFIPSGALFIFVITLLSNAWLQLRLRPTTTVDSSTLVSILIPARNEAANIEATLAAVQRQSYTNFELLVLDDNSTDATGSLVAAAAAADTRIRLLSGEALPAGWLGKNYACWQLAQAATGDYLLFIDADVALAPDAVASIITLQQAEQADLLTVWPTQTTVTWSERLVVPLMALAIHAYLPLIGVHYLPFGAFAAANGQCLSFRRAAYDQIGGHTTVRDNIVEDVALARAVKQSGGCLRMADGNHLVGCRMYQNWDEVKAGFGKNILAGHNSSVPFLAASTLFHWLLFVAPWIWLAFGSATPGWPWWPALLVTGSLGLRIGSAALTQQRWLDGLLMPLSVWLMTRIAWQSVRWHFGNGPEWKGRVATAQQTGSKG